MFTSVFPALYPWVIHGNRGRRHWMRADAVRETWCGLSGHDFLFHTERGRVFLKCADCGRETPGWQFGTAVEVRARR